MSLLRAFFAFSFILAAKLSAEPGIHGFVGHEEIRNLADPNIWQHKRSTLSLRSQDNLTEESSQKILWQWHLHGILRYDEALANSERYESRVESAYIAAYGNSWLVKAGWQTLSWGESLGPSLVDLANVQDLREPAAWLRSDQKLSAPIVSTSWNHNDWNYDLWLSPNSPAPKLPKQWLGLPLNQALEKRKNEFGLRIGTLLQGWDAKAYVFKHAARLPVVRYQLGEQNLEFSASFPSQISYGMSVSQTHEAFVLRSEALLTTSQSRPADNLLAIPQKQLTLGLDSSHHSEFWLAGEVRWSHSLSNRAGDTELLWLIMQAHYNILQGKIKPAFSVSQRLDADESLKRLELAAELNESLKMTIAWESLRGAAGTLLGLWNTPDLASLDLRWDF